MNKEAIIEVKETLRSSLRKKFTNHNSEPASMPFHTSLLGKDRLALYQFIHSLNTNFGTTIFEPVAIILAKERFKIAEKQVSSGSILTENALYEIQKIIDELSIAKTNPEKREEIERIRRVCKNGVEREVNPTRIDLYLESNDSELYLIDLKTAKPNAGEFKGFKRTLLEWVAVTLFKNPEAKINTLIAIPYNPYEPEPYNRWTIRGMIDLEKELKVAKEFWDFVGGLGAYEDLLGCFEQVGIEMRDEIDKYFSKYNK